jgi:hypothetical protein
MPRILVGGTLLIAGRASHHELTRRDRCEFHSERSCCLCSELRRLLCAQKACQKSQRGDGEQQKCPDRGRVRKERLLASAALICMRLMIAMNSDCRKTCRLDGPGTSITVNAFMPGTRNTRLESENSRSKRTRVAIGVYQRLGSRQHELGLAPQVGRDRSYEWAVHLPRIGLFLLNKS